MQHGLTIEVHTMGRTVDEQTVDQWELKAATRALNNLRTLGAGKPLTELLRDQIDVGDNFHRSLIASSDGTFRESRTELRVRGLTGTEFAGWFASFMSKQLATGNPADKAKLLFTHPEHYVQPPEFPNGGNVEPIGGHLARFTATIAPELPDEVARHIDPDYPITVATAALHLADGTIFAYCLHQARDTELGADILVRVLYSSAASDALIEGHCEHLAIEFRNWIRDAAKDVHGI